MSHTEGPHEDGTGAGGALAAFNVTLLPDHMLGEILARSHSDDLLAIISTCKMFGRIQRLDTSREVRAPPDAHIVTSAALHTWAVENGWPWPTDHRFAACNLAAERGCIAVMQRARADGHEWNAGACTAAAKGGHLELLQWLHANGCPWNQDTCNAAASHGQHDCP